MVVAALSTSHTFKLKLVVLNVSGLPQGPWCVNAKPSLRTMSHHSLVSVCRNSIGIVPVHERVIDHVTVQVLCVFITSGSEVGVKRIISLAGREPQGSMT